MTSKIWVKITLKKNFQGSKIEILILSKAEKDAQFQKVATLFIRNNLHEAFHCILHAYSNNFKLLKAFGYKPVTYWWWLRNIVLNYTNTT